MEDLCGKWWAVRSAVLPHDFDTNLVSDEATIYSGLPTICGNTRVSNIS